MARLVYRQGKTLGNRVDLLIKVLHTAMDEIIDKLHCDINLERIMDGRKILAWEMTIIRKGATPSWKKISNQDVGEQTALDLDI